jgi:hypothetical protein
LTNQEPSVGEPEGVDELPVAEKRRVTPLLISSTPVSPIIPVAPYLTVVSVDEPKTKNRQSVASKNALSSDEIMAVLDESMAEFSRKWIEKERPQFHARSHTLWKQVQGRREDLQMELADITDRVRAFLITKLTFVAAGKSRASTCRRIVFDTNASSKDGA